MEQRTPSTAVPALRAAGGQTHRVTRTLKTVGTPPPSPARPRTRWHRPRLVVVVTLAAAATAAACGTSPGRPASSSSTTGGMPAGTDPAVGPLFPTATGTVHTCTASVVDSPGHDLLLTAAHCVAGTGAGMSFAPGAVDSHEPYGRWTVTAAYAMPAWTNGQNPQADVAVLVVAPRFEDGRKVEVQDRTGGHPLGTEPATHTTVTVTGYPFGVGGRPVTCRAPVRMTGGFPTFTCPGFVAGTSGGPWVSTSKGHAVVGVIGGLHQGGCRPDVSYTAAFTGIERRAYEAAVAGHPPSPLPPPGPDGC
jgi:hypothetical protein